MNVGPTDKFMTDKQALKLFRIANTLENYRVDNGPNGEHHPFADEVAQLREIAGEDTDDDDEGESSQFN